MIGHNKAILCTAVVIIVAAIVAIIFFNQTSPIFSVENDKNGNIVVTEQNAGKNASGMGYITLQKEQKLEVMTNLTDSSLIVCGKI